MSSNVTRRPYLWVLVTGIVLVTASRCPADPGDPRNRGPVIQEGGTVISDPVVQDDRSVVSPIIIVPPLLDCGVSVQVRGFVPGARIRIYEGTSVIGSGIGWDPEGQVFEVSPSLVRDQRITATQEVDGTEGDPSIEVRVQSHTEVYPSGLPQPRFPYLPLYDCGIATVVDQLPPGGSVRVYSPTPPDPANEVGYARGVAAGQTVGIPTSFQVGRLVVAQSQICSDLSPVSETHRVQAAPTTLPAPEVTGIYDEGRILTVHQLVNGAKVEIKRGGSYIGGGGAPAGHVRFGLNTSVSASDVLEITQSLCGVPSPTTTVTVRPCGELPPPVMRAPDVGDTVVYFSDVVAGSRIRIYSAGVQIGHGGGSAIALVRPLEEGEVLVAIQSLGRCEGTSAYQIGVGTGLTDPVDPGPCGSDPRTYTYGYPNDAETPRTDVSEYFNSPDYRVTESMDDVPLQGIVRYPRGPGPFPLVLIVHGNHNPTRPSAPGYEYLLNHWASHCCIAVSVTEDFLNGDVGGEMDARAIVLLRHLQLWRNWNSTPGHTFFTKVDMGRIGLLGHSRGGEAVVAAELMNHSHHDASDPDHNFNFDIQSLFGIAPVDGQYDDGAITLQGADYYVMHGSHDGDVSTFSGHRTYDRAYPVSGTTGNYKGLLYVYGANHAQWNTVWTAAGGDPFSITGTVPLISAANQQLIGKSYMTSHLLASLKGWFEYRRFFSGEATFGSLPTGITRVFQYQDPDRVFINHYEEDDDLKTASFSGLTNTETGTFKDYEDYAFQDRGPPHFLWGQTDGLIAGWEVSGTEISIDVTSDLRDAMRSRKYLALRLGQTHESSPDLNMPGNTRDMSIQFTFGDVDGPEIPVGDYFPLVYPQVTDAPFWGGGPKSVQQTIRIPYPQFLYGLDGVDLDDLTRIRLKFNRNPKGRLAIDEVQFTK